MSSSTIDDRVVLLIKDQMTRRESVKAREVKSSLLERLLPASNSAEEMLSVLQGGRGFWKVLAERTGISADRWRKVFERKQRPTTDILGAIGQQWPHHAFWVMTGITDAVNGHVAPDTATTYPERGHIRDQCSINYFRASVALSEQLFNDERIEQIEFEEPIDLIERTRPFTHHWEGAITSLAYQQSNTESYRLLIELWHEREGHREQHKTLVMRQEPSAKGGDPVLGEDPRTAHQNPFYLFYEARHGDTKD